MQVEVDLQNITCNPDSLDNPDIGPSRSRVGAAHHIRDPYRHMEVTILKGVYKTHTGSVKSTEEREGVEYVIVNTETPPTFYTVTLRVDDVRERL